MEKDIQRSLKIYQQQLNEGSIQEAYYYLMRYIGKLKTVFPKSYQTGNISFGYLDFSYFPFTNQYLKERKLRFGIVLNHQKLQFELWLMGQNSEIQQKYWEIFKNTKWNVENETMPKYSILEAVLTTNINFNNTDEMTKQIIDNATLLAFNIQEYLKSIEI